MERRKIYPSITRIRWIPRAASSAAASLSSRSPGITTGTPGGQGTTTWATTRPAARRTVTDLPGANTASRMEQARSSRGISMLGGGVGLPWGISRTAFCSRTRSPSRLIPPGGR